MPFGLTFDHGWAGSLSQDSSPCPSPAWGSAGHTGAFLFLFLNGISVYPKGGSSWGAAVPGTHNLAGLASKGVTRLPVTDLGKRLHLKKSINKKSRAEGRKESLCGVFFFLSFFSLLDSILYL